MIRSLEDKDVGDEEEKLWNYVIKRHKSYRLLLHKHICTHVYIVS